MATKRNFKAFSVAAASSPMNGCKSRKLTEKILKEAYAQQKEVEDEENTPMSAFSFKQPLYELEDVIDDDVDEIQSQLDYHEDMACSEKEEKLLLDAFFHKDGASIAKRVSDAITSSLEEKHIAATGAAFDSITDYYRK
ncbi:BnaA07g08410D [Brassica napus]|nr:BnaA07g08410D [Brassica napus]